MKQIFWGFSRNWFLTSPLHYLSSRSDFGFELAKIFVLEKRLPAITNTGSHQLPASLIHGVGLLSASLIRGVGDSPHHRYGELAIGFLKRNLSVSMIRRVVDSPHQ
jgi:hypothetical protein